MAHQQVAKELEKEGIKANEDILSGIISLVDELHLEGEDVVAEWQAFALNKKNAIQSEDIIDQSAFRKFSKFLRVSQSARCAKKTRSRSSQFGVHSNKSLQPLMEQMSTPSRSSKRPVVPPQSTGTKQKNNDDLFDAFLSMQTPSKQAPTTPMAASASMTASVSRTRSAVKTNRGHTVSDPTATPSLMQSPAPRQSTSSRRSGDKVTETLNGSLPINHQTDSVKMEVIVPGVDGADYPWTVVPLGANSMTDNLQSVYDVKRQRFMMEDVHSKQEAMRERIEYIGHFLMAQIQREEALRMKQDDDDNDLEDDDDGKSEDVVVWSALDEPSQRECYFLGRLQNDGDDAGSDKLTAGNVVMESVDGKRVRINLQNLESMALFPGQIVAVRGLNTSGKEVIASKIYQNAGLSERIGNGGNNTANNTTNGNHDANVYGEVVQMVIACGPFTGRESVEFTGSTMHILAETVNARRPNVVVLMGPFTDCENERIKRGEIECSLDELFENLLTAFLQSVQVDGVQIVVMPSTKDVHHFSAFPQHRYQWKNRMNPNVHFVPNPAELRLNNVRIGMSSADLLFDFVRIGLIKNKKDRLLTMMTHCIEQQNFYPLQPAAKALRMDYNQHRSLYLHDKLDLLITWCIYTLSLCDWLTDLRSFGVFNTFKIFLLTVDTSLAFSDFNISQNPSPIEVA